MRRDGVRRPDPSEPRPAPLYGSPVADGLHDPETFIHENKIGFPVHNVSPRRKLSWWLNPSLEAFALLRDGQHPNPAPPAGWVTPRA